MINYIQNKTIDYKQVRKYLYFSEIERHWSNNGPVKALLEDKISDMINLPKNKKVLCTSSGTSALHSLMFYLSYINKFDLKWVTPAFTFPSAVVNSLGTDIVDIDLATYTARGDDTKNYDGVIVTNLFGTICKIDHSDCFQIYDNASSFMSKDQNGKNICLMGNAAFGSLHHTKTFGFGEGGFLVIDSDIFSEVQRTLGFGFDMSRNFRNLSSNFKMSDVSAAFILQHMENYSTTDHLAVQNYLVSKIQKMEGVSLFNYSEGVFYGNLPLVFQRPIDIVHFREKGIEANKYYKPLSKNAMNSWQVYDSVINLPLHEDLTPKEADYMLEVIEELS